MILSSLKRNQWLACLLPFRAPSNPMATATKSGHPDSDSRLGRFSSVVSESVEGVCEVGGWLVNFEPTPTKRGPGIGLTCAKPHIDGDAKFQTSGSHLCITGPKISDVTRLNGALNYAWMLEDSNPTAI